MVIEKVENTFKKPFRFVLFVDFASNTDLTVGTAVLQGDFDPSWLLASFDIIPNTCSTTKQLVKEKILSVICFKVLQFIGNLSDTYLLLSLQHKWYQRWRFRGPEIGHGLGLRRNMYHSWLKASTEVHVIQTKKQWAKGKRKPMVLQQGRYQ